VPVHIAGIAVRWDAAASTAPESSAVGDVSQTVERDLRQRLVHVPLRERRTSGGDAYLFSAAAKSFARLWL